MRSIEETLAKICQPLSVTDSILLVNRDTRGDIVEIERERNLLINGLLEEQSTDALRKMQSKYTQFLEWMLFQKNEGNHASTPGEIHTLEDMLKESIKVQEAIKRKVALEMLAEVIWRINELLEKREY